jgi:hypothetical protein
MNINNVMNKVGCIAICSWSTLGFKRGIDSYNYNCKKSLSSSLHVNKIFWGVTGTVFYITPILCFIAAYKEIYRLEVNLRGLEDEKKTCFYNEIL